MTKPGGFEPSFRITNRATAALTRIERARGFLDVAKLSEDWLVTMRSRVEAHHTTLQKAVLKTKGRGESR